MKKVLGIIMILFLLTGCNFSNNSNTKTTEEFIHIGDNTVIEGYEEICSVKDYSFCVRRQDLDNISFFNDYSSNSVDSDVPVIYDRISSMGHLVIQDVDGGQLYKTDSSYLLYSPGNALYFMNTGNIFENSVSVFEDKDILTNNISKYLINIGISDIVFDEESLIFNKNNRTGEYAFKVNINFKDKDLVLYEADVYVWEDVKAQNIFIVAGTSVSMTKDEREYIGSSVKKSDTFLSGLNGYDSENISFDYNGVLFNGDFNKALGFKSDISDLSNYSNLEEYDGYTSLTTFNNYYPFMAKLAVYTLDVPATNEDLINIPLLANIEEYKPINFPKEFASLSYGTTEFKELNNYELYDSDNNLWINYSYGVQDWEHIKIYNYFDYTSIYISVRGNKCILFQTWGKYNNFEFYSSKMDEMIKSLSVTEGITNIPAPIEDMTVAYYDFYGYPETEVEFSTPTDAVATSGDAVLDLGY